MSLNSPLMQGYTSSRSNSNSTTYHSVKSNNITKSNNSTTSKSSAKTAKKKLSETPPQPKKSSPKKTRTKHSKLKEIAHKQGMRGHGEVFKPLNVSNKTGKKLSPIITDEEKLKRIEGIYEREQIYGKIPLGPEHLKQYKKEQAMRDKVAEMRNIHDKIRKGQDYGDRYGSIKGGKKKTKRRRKNRRKTKRRKS